ncbi:ABC transporter ATP-binding protein [Paracoccus sp. Z118]|nr:ABC transporter ATP-binding protein [Paracoccus sp. Z118]MBV0892367.1 ABC transporter ATP-binding protein [Paracoccus sp. Z118]
MTSTLTISQPTEHFRARQAAAAPVAVARNTAPEAGATLRIAGLSKRYQAVQALDDVSLTLLPGMRVALLGHNGAGKSTMMKIILGLIPYDGGTIEVCGEAPGSAGARAQVAYLPENAAFHPALTGQEQIRHYLALRGEDPKQALELLERVGLGHAARRRIGTYSKGMRQRVGLAQTLIGKPRLLVLDEPTSGLDPVSRRDFYALLDQLAAEGASILLSSHALTEVEARTDRILILSGGRLVAQGTLPELRHEAALPVAMHVTPAPGQTRALAEAIPEAGIGNDGLLHLTCQQSEKLALLARISALGGRVADLDVIPPSLEDIYSHFSRRDGQ